MEGRDIDLFLAQQSAERADKARLVEIVHIQHGRAEIALERHTFYLNNARLPRNQCAGERAPARIRIILGALGQDFDPDQAVIDRAFLGFRLGQFHPAFGQYSGRGHHIHIPARSPQEPGQCGGGQRFPVQLRNLAFILDHDFFEAIIADLTGEQAELLGKGRKWFQTRRFICCN